MKSIKTKLTLANVGSIIIAFSLVTVVAIIVSQKLIEKFLDLSSKRSSEISEQFKRSSEDNKEKIRSMIQESMSRKGQNLLKKDLLTLKTPFFENQIGYIQDFLLESHLGDTDIVLTNLIQFEDGEVSAWQLVSPIIQDGIRKRTVYDFDTKDWVTSVGENELRIPDPGVESALDVRQASIRSIQYELKQPDGSVKSIPALEAIAPIFYGDTQEDLELELEDGEQVGFLRYVISLESMMSAIEAEEKTLQAIFVEQQKQSQAARDQTRELGKQAQAETVSYMAFTAAITLGVGFIISRFISLKFSTPIISLVQASKTIASGNYDQSVEASTDDEIGQLCGSFDEMRLKVKEFTEHLQELVDEKTEKLNDALLLVTEEKQKIQEIMDKIEQGILTFDSSMKIDEQFSAFLMTVFDQDAEQIAGCDPIEFALSKSNLSDDELDMVRQSLMAILDENAVAWDANQFHLPRQLSVLVNAQKKALAFEWYPMVGEQDCVSKVMLCIKDVTEQLRLREEIEKSNQRKAELMRKISELVVANKHSVTTAFKDASQNISIISEYLEFSKFDTENCFRMLHTMKGVFRTLNIRTLKDLAHELETQIHELKNDPKRDLVYFKNKYLEFKLELESYTHVIENVLGWQLGESNFNNFNLINMLAEHTKQVVSLISPYGIKVSDIECKDEVIYWKANAISKIEAILTHSITNAVDHGYIKHFKDRIKNDWKVSLSIQAFYKNDRVIIEVRDKGKGFREIDILESARRKGYPIPETNPLDVLFLDGMSTAEKVSETSGRGVGLSAIKAIVDDLGGRISLHHNQPVGALIRVELPAKKVSFYESVNLSNLAS